MHRDRLRASLLFAILLLSACARTEERGPDSAELRDPWALAAEPSDPIQAAGKRVFAACASCHLADAGGRTDGTIPRLAGQDATVLEARLQALIDGSRDLPVMTPFARALTESEVREVAAYLSSLPRPEWVGVGSGKEIERGSAVYGAFCAGCHGEGGVGLPTLKAPRLCGQHEAYLLRRMNEIADADARAVDPNMRAIVMALSQGDRRAVSDHLARRSCN